MPKTISIDIDGVLANFTDAFAVKLREVGVPVPEGFEPNDWDFGGSGATPEQFDAAWRLVAKTENFWLSLGAYQANIKAFNAFLHKRGEDIYFVTSRVPSAGLTVKEQTEMWLIEHVLYFGGVVVKPRGVTKAEIYRALGITHSIDDYPKNVRPAVGLPGHRAFLLDRPWNQEATDLPRVKTLAEFLEIVKND